jgi:hypothetical protein
VPAESLPYGPAVLAVDLRSERNAPLPLAVTCTVRDLVSPGPSTDRSAWSHPTRWTVARSRQIPDDRTNRTPDRRPDRVSRHRGSLSPSGSRVPRRSSCGDRASCRHRRQDRSAPVSAARHSDPGAVSTDPSISGARLLPRRGGPRRFTPVFTVPALLGMTTRGCSSFAYGAVTHCGAPFLNASARRQLCNSVLPPVQQVSVPRPRSGNATGLFHQIGLG